MELDLLEQIFRGTESADHENVLPNRQWDFSIIAEINLPEAIDSALESR
jgi:hypothetical protein